MNNCSCHCHNNHGNTPEAHCKCIPSCIHCNPVEAEKMKWSQYDYMNDPIFTLLNCYEVDASEVRHGVTYIDSSEAEFLTRKIRQLLEKGKKE